MPTLTEFPLNGLNSQAVYNIGGNPVQEMGMSQVQVGAVFIANRTYAAVANGANADMRFVVPSGKQVHAVLGFGSSGIITAFLYEAGNVTAGTAMTPVNLNRNSANASTCTVTYTPTVTTTGTEIMSRKMANTSHVLAKFGGELHRNMEWILKANTTYLVRVTNGSGGNLDITISVEFWEA